MINAIITPVVVMGLLGLVFGGILAFASQKLAVPQDERVPKVRAKLPGANCGGCGFPGCDALAAAIVSGEAPVNGCPVGGAKVAEAVAEVMGADAGATEPMAARVLCNGDCEKAPRRADYYGIADCREAVIANGGPKACRFGCIGLGTCVNNCSFDALTMGDNGLPVVNVEQCTSCGKCVDVCPRSIIELIPKNSIVHVNCRSKEKGKIVRTACETGCIGCKACEKVCPAGAVSVSDNLARVDYEKCINCGACVRKCPTGALVKEDRVVPRKKLVRNPKSETNASDNKTE